MLPFDALMYQRAVLLTTVLLATLTPTAAAASLRLSAAEDAAGSRLALGSSSGDLAYTPGRGLRISDSGLTLGGYVNATFTRDEGRAAAAEIDDVSLFVIYDPTPRLHLFTEIEYADLVAIEGGRVTNADEALTIERLSADVRISDAVNLRAGILLTPVGQWNSIHAAPLVWTTSRPLTTETFDPNLTGIMLFGTVLPGAGALTYMLYDQFALPLEGNPEFDPADHSVGARLEWGVTPQWSLGASYLAARRDGAWRHLGGVDLLWSHRLVEMMGEIVVADGGSVGVEWGGYLQAALGLTQRLSLVERYEHFAAPKPAPSVDLVSLGLAFRPVPAAVLKVEYLIACRSGPNADPGFKASIATLF